MRRAWLLILVWALGTAGRAEPLFCDPDLPVDVRVADLISRLTVEEKMRWIEMDAPAIPRLSIPAYSWWGESVRGVARAGRATMFPQAIALAATWDVDLMFRVATAISDEARAKHRQNPRGRFRGLTFFAPCVNLIRDPRWGRAQESYSEDPHLTAEMALAYIRGMQGDHPHYLKTAAMVKHLAVHSQESGRFERSVAVSERQMREYYLPAFYRSLTEAGSAGVMVAFNGINEIPCTANEWLITDLLRGEWGVNWPVVTDYGAVSNLREHHKLVATDEAAVQAALYAGVDVICQPSSIFSNIYRAVTNQLVSAADLDRALERSLPVLFRLGLFDPPERVPFAQLPPETIGSDAHRALSREASRASLVLLKNDRIPGRHNPAPILPVDPRRLDSIAVLGPFANNAYMGNYTGDPAAKPVTVLAGLRDRLDPRLVLRDVPWFDLDEHLARLRNDKKLDDEKRAAETAKVQSRAQEALTAALAAAGESDLAIVVLGLGPKHENEFTDRRELGLPRDQQEFIEKVFAANPATVVVLFNGGPLAVPWLAQNVPAIVEAWLSGEQGGAAIAEMLVGDYNPAGRLPVTCYASLDQLPPLDDYDITRGRTYLYLTEPPLYPFGHGLSYTTFGYDRLQLTRTNDTLLVTCDVTNTGARDGEEVVQVYVRQLQSSVPVPQHQLRGFRRIKLPAGGTQSVTVPVRLRDLAIWDETASGWKWEPGEIEVQVGASAGDIRLRERVTVE